MYIDEIVFGIHVIRVLGHFVKQHHAASSSGILFYFLLYLNNMYLYICFWRTICKKLALYQKIVKQ